jgi:hypothetical protein
MARTDRSSDAVHRARKPVGERLRGIVQWQAARRGLEWRSLRDPVEGLGADRTLAARVQHVSSAQLVGLPAPRTGGSNVYPEPAKNRIGCGVNTGGWSKRRGFLGRPRSSSAAATRKRLWRSMPTSFMELSSRLPPIPPQKRHGINDLESRAAGRGYRIRSVLKRVSSQDL